MFFFYYQKDEFLNKNIKTQKITKPFPITFRTDERAFKSLTKNEALKEEKDNQFFFKAKEAPDFSKKFFNLKPLSLRKSMDFSEFKLLTAKRAEMRSDYENVLKNRKIFEEKRELYIFFKKIFL